MKSDFLIKTSKSLNSMMSGCLNPWSPVFIAELLKKKQHMALCLDIFFVSLGIQSVENFGKSMYRTFLNVGIWRRIEARHPSLVQGVGGFGAHFQPVARLCFPVKTSASWTHEHAGALRSAVTNRHCAGPMLPALCCLWFGWVWFQWPQVPWHAHA